ncbi:MAG: translation initiation factor IF-2 [Thaumarchaeota archaeon]|nr:translation initiation factor IF-2 [Nitrososphaerota archaeon]
MQLRQPVVAVLGHVDSGKTSLLDKIRGTAVQVREVGSITQHIGASFFPIETIKQVCGTLLEKSNTEIKIPGLLVIDTPGHEVFANLRMRGGSAADIAILVLDVMKGFEAQTHESLEILKNRKVPFIVALNKIDMIPGWKNNNTTSITQSIKQQQTVIADDLDQRLYTVVGTLSMLGFNSEAFYRVKDFTKEIVIVPVSAKTGEGIPELLTMLVGITQRFMQTKLEVRENSARGIVLEVNEEVGLGSTINVILLDGTIRQGNTIVLAKRNDIVTAKAKVLLLPKPLDEMRDPRDKFVQVEEVSAAAGIKIASGDLDGVLAGSPVYVAHNESEIANLKDLIESEIKSIVINTDKTGVVIKCDTLGSLEAVTEMLKKEGVSIRIADIGPVTRRDIVEASAVKEKDRYLGVIISFNVRMFDNAETEARDRSVKIFNEQIIYNLVKGYTDWVSYEKEREESTIFNELITPCKFVFLKGFVFRRNDPAIFGVEIKSGRLKQKSNIMNKIGKTVGIVHKIQDKGKSIDEAKKDMQVAVSMNEPSIGRHINEGDMLYTLPPNEHVKLLVNRFKYRLNEAEVKTLDETLEIKRKTNPLYGY